MAQRSKTKPKETKLQVNLLDMNEHIFRHVFQYLPVRFIFRKLRLVCRKINYHVNTYVQLLPEKLFLQPTGYPKIRYELSTKNVQPEYFSLLKDVTGRIVSLHSKMLPGIPYLLQVM